MSKSQLMLDMLNKKKPFTLNYHFTLPLKLLFEASDTACCESYDTEVKGLTSTVTINFCCPKLAFPLALKKFRS